MEDRCKTLMAEAVQTQQANENVKSQVSWIAEFTASIYIYIYLSCE